MGRKTFESIGRPLPNRRNIIISRNSEYAQEGCEVFSSIDTAIAALKDEEKIYIIGGGEIYKSTLPLASKIELTVVEQDYEGDTVFPVIDSDEWEILSSEHYEHGERFEYSFRFETLIRKK